MSVPGSGLETWILSHLPHFQFRLKKDLMQKPETPAKGMFTTFLRKSHEKVIRV